MISPDEAIRILKSKRVPKNVIKHCMVVAKYSKELALVLKNSGVPIDVNKVEIGALLHDIGRSKTHGVLHWYYGYRILKELGLDDYAGFALTHVGTWMGLRECTKLGIPLLDYRPRTPEEEIVAYVDKRVIGERFVSERDALLDLEKKLGQGSLAFRRYKRFFQLMHKKYPVLDLY